VDPDPADAPLASRRAVAYSGTSVVGGRGEGIVVAIGRATEFGRIAGGLASRERRRSPLQRELDRLVRILLVVAVGLIVFTSGMGFLRGHPLGENVLAGISSAIAAIPEEPPVLLAVILGLGAYRLLKRGVLVRRLNAEEDARRRRPDVTDKTGTSPRTGSRCHRSGRSTGPSRTRPARRGLLEEAPRAEEDAWPGEGVAPASFTRPSGGRRRRRRPDRARRGQPRGGRAGIRRAAGHPNPRAPGRPRRGLALARPGDRACLRRGRLAGDDREGAVGRPDRLLRGHRRAARRAGAPRVDDGPWEMRALVGFADPIRPGHLRAIAMARARASRSWSSAGDHPRTAATIAREAGLQPTASPPRGSRELG